MGRSTVKARKKVGTGSLVNWYYGNFCARCRLNDIECLDKINEAVKCLPDEMTHKEFADFIRKGTTFCKPARKEFPECPLCKAVGVPRQRH